MKKITFISILFLSFVLPPIVHAQFTQQGDSPGTTAETTGRGQSVTSGFVALAPIEGLTRGVVADQTGLPNFFNNLYKYLIGLAATLAVIMIIWGGLEYSTQDSISKKSDGKERIYQAIFGLVLVLSPVLIFSIINPAILNLSINLPPLDTRTAAPAQTTPRVLPTCTSVVTQNCTPRAQAVFREGFYASPPTGIQPSGVWCYQMKTAASEGSFSCFRDELGCRSTRRTSCGYASEDISCPADSRTLDSCPQTR